MIRLKASALDEARTIYGYTSDEKLAGAMGMSGTSIRSLRHGRTSPTVETLVKLRGLTRIPLDDLIYEQQEDS